MRASAQTYFASVLPTGSDTGSGVAVPKVTFVSFAGDAHTVQAPVGTSLMRAATEHQVAGIDGDCGGNCACATCHVYVAADWCDRVGSRTATEQDMLHCVAELQGNSRLACQITLTDALDGLVVSLPEAQH